LNGDLALEEVGAVLNRYRGDGLEGRGDDFFRGFQKGIFMKMGEGHSCVFLVGARKYKGFCAGVEGGDI